MADRAIRSSVALQFQVIEAIRSRVAAPYIPAARVQPASPHHAEANARCANVGRSDWICTVTLDDEESTVLSDVSPFVQSVIRRMQLQYDLGVAMD